MQVYRYIFSLQTDKHIFLKHLELSIFGKFYIFLYPLVYIVQGLWIQIVKGKEYKGCSKLKILFLLAIDIWYKIFLYCLGSNIFFHIIAALFAFRSLHKHRLGRYFPIVIAIVGFLYPITGGLIASKSLKSFES